MAARNRQLLSLATPYFPLGIRNPLRKFIAPRQRIPALGHCNFSGFQSRGAGRQIASVCETDFAPGIGALCVCNPECPPTLLLSCRVLHRDRARDSEPAQLARGGRRPFPERRTPPRL